MKFRTRLRVTFVTIILLPLVLTALAFITIGVYLVNMQQGFSLEALDYAVMSDGLKSFINTTDEAYYVLLEQAQKDPAMLEDMEYLEMVNSDISRRTTYILVRKGDEIYYTGNEAASRVIFPKLPDYGEADLGEDSGVYYDDLEKFVKQIDFTFSDGTQGSVFVITKMNTLISKQLLIDMFIAILLILVFTSVMLTQWIHKGVFNPIDELNAAKEEYNSLAASGATDDVTMATLNAMYEEIQKGEAAIAQAQDQIDSAKAELESGQDQINSGWNQITAGEQELADAEAKLEEAEAEIADGWEEYYEGEAEAEAEIADGEQKIADAKEELADAENEINDIEMPEWYIYDRSNLPDYTGYGENADRMRAIGEVFPAIFFLVAALISLTTMTRMVEEQRTQIGTLKALGYERHSIAGKYLGYALLATVSGSVVGILFGEKVFPYIIINAYGIMYQHMNDIVIPYNLEYGLGAAAAALASTLLATIFSCYKELREQAAELMRPPTPKQGQRVMLERVKFIWKRLNFSWKASIRNLVRYKKRLFMTIFGIGGCMALMLVGFGLKDSIFAIVDIQYGEIQLYDGNIILSDDATEEEKSNIITTLEKDSKMDGSTEGILSQITVGNGEEWHDVYLDVPKNVEEFSEFVVLQDRVTNEKYELDDSGAILTEKMATELDVEPGDTVTIRDENRGDLEVEISAVCENYMSHYLYMTPAYYEKVYGDQPDYNSIFYKTADRITEEAERIGEEALTLPGALSVSYTTDLREQVDNMLGALDEVIVVLIISAGMLAFVVLYNLNNINITERQRELATLKVLGFYNGEVAMYVYRENIVLTVLGAVFGIVLGKFLHGFIIVTVEIESVMFGRNIDLSSFIYGFLLTILFSLLVNGAMYFKLKKINMVESLKSVE